MGREQAVTVIDRDATQDVAQDATLQLLIFSPFLVLGLLTVSVTVTKGKQPRQKLDFEISRLALPTKLFQNSHATFLVDVDVLRSKTPR